MGKPIIDDELWTLIEPLLPPPKPRREKNPGRLPVSNRAALTGTLFVLKTGLRWRDLPAEMGCGSGDLLATTTRLAGCGRMGLPARVAAREAASSRRNRLLASRRRFIIDSRRWGGPKTGPNPTDRATRFQAPYRHRRQRHAARRDLDRRECQRHHAIAASDRRDSTDSHIENRISVMPLWLCGGVYDAN